MNAKWVERSIPGQEKGYDLETDFGLGVHLGEWVNGSERDSDWYVLYPWANKPVFYSSTAFTLDQVKRIVERRISEHLMQFTHELKAA